MPVLMPVNMGREQRDNGGADAARDAARHARAFVDGITPESLRQLPR
jgi:hypothetical protein